MAYVDFHLLKQRVSIEQVVDMLGLQLKRVGAQLRGPCPTHGSGDRALVVTPEKGLFYNFCGDCQFGGDMIELASKVQGISQKDAAVVIAKHFGVLECKAVTSAPEIVAEVAYPGRGRGALQPLDYLVTDHECLAPFGISKETYVQFGAGYAPKGIMRGRLAIPIYRDGILLAYVGRAVKRDQEPMLLYPRGFEATGIIFNADSIGSGALSVTDDPLKVLVCHAHGIGNAVGLLGTIDADVLESLAALMRDRNCAQASFL